MPKFKDFFKKPSILSYKPENTLVCHNVVTPITVQTLGWGWLHIKAKAEPTWSGIKKYQSINDQQITASVPQGKELQISIYNCFGKSKLIIAPITANSALHEIIAPQYPIYNKNLLNVIKPPKCPSFNKVQYAFKKATINNYGLPKNNLQTVIQLSKQSLLFPKNRIVLSKVNLINQPINLFKPPFNYLGFTRNLKLNSIKISNKIDTKFIQND